MTPLGSPYHGSPFEAQESFFETDAGSTQEADEPLRSSQSNASSNRQDDGPLSIYVNIHRVRRLILATLDDPYTLDQLKAPRMNIVVVRPLVNRLYDPDDPSVVYCLLANRIQFLREQSNVAHLSVNIARASLCELVASRILRRFNEDHEGPIGLLLLAHILVNGFDPFQGCPEDIEVEYRYPQWPAQRRSDGQGHKITALELAIISESKLFISSFACQKVINAVYEGRIVYTPISIVDILPDHYESCPVSLYDPRATPVLDHSRLVVPRVRGVLELCQFVVLVTLYILTMTRRSNPNISIFEAIFCVYAVGWSVDEFAAVIEHGWEVYSQTLWSFLDMTFIAIFLAYAVARLSDISIGRIADGYGIHILCLAAPVLLTRIAFASMPDNIVFISLHAVMKNFTLLTFIALWCFTGFLLALLWLNSSDPSKNTSDPDWIKVCKWLLWIWFGLDGTGFDYSAAFHPILGPALMTSFAFLGNTLFLTILVALLTNTFSKIIEDAPAEIQFRRAVLTFAGVKSDSIFAYPPPFNLLALLVLLPLKPFLAPSKFHTLNVALIRILNFPALLIINAYERGSSWAQNPNNRKQSLLHWNLNFSGFSPHGDIQAVFQAEPPREVVDELEEMDALSDLGYAESELVSPTSFSRRRLGTNRRGRDLGRGRAMPSPLVFPLSSALSTGSDMRVEP